MKTILSLVVLCAGVAFAAPLPSTFKFAPIVSPTFRNLVRIEPTSGGSSTLLKVGNTDAMPIFSGLDSTPTSGVLTVRASSIFGAQIHSEHSNGLVASSTNGQAAKFIQKNQAYNTANVPVVRIHRAATLFGYPSSSPVLLIEDVGGVGLGGPCILVRKNNSTVFAVDAAGRPILRSPGGNLFALQVTDSGVLSTTPFSGF